jgi:hypothetical protein
MVPTERLSVMQTDEIERQYISEYYNDSSQFDALDYELTKFKSEQVKKQVGSDKLLGRIAMPSKIKSVLYCQNGNYLCVGL